MERPGPTPSPACSDRASSSGVWGWRTACQSGVSFSLPTATRLSACVFFGLHRTPRCGGFGRVSGWGVTQAWLGTRTRPGSGDRCGRCLQECRVWSLHEPRPCLWTCRGGQPLGLPLGLLAGAARGQPARGRTHQVGVWLLAPLVDTWSQRQAPGPGGRDLSWVCREGGAFFGGEGHGSGAFASK